MPFLSCSYAAATYQPKLLDCDGNPLPAGTEMATCADLAGLSIPDATDTTKGKVALNAGTSLPGDATNCTDALTACGLNALLTDPAAGGNAVINNVKALVPLATTTIPGLIEEATGEETRLGATDANRADRAVTPGSMSYALQNLLEYPIRVRTSGSLNSATINDITTVTAGDSYGFVAVINGTQNSPVSTAVLARSNIDTAVGQLTQGVRGSCSGVVLGTAHGVAGDVQASGSGVAIGVFGSAQGAATNWAGYFNGNVASGAITTLSDATLKENVQAIDPAKALQFRNGLRWVSYEMFTEQQVEIMQTVTDGEGNETQVPTGRYEVKRNSLGKKRGLIAQEVQALAASIGDFSDVVAEVGEYFTLDAQGYPVKDAQGNNIVNKRLGLDYDAVSFIVMCAEQSALIPA